MNAVSVVRGRAMPLDRANVDTDQIIPASYLKRIGRTGFADGLFAHWRRDPAFVLNDPRYAGASVLVCGPNFGCGSSREHAAWALQEHGFAAIVAPSFGDIFRTNALGIGLVPAAISEPHVRALLDAVRADPAVEVEVDVEARAVRVPALGLATAFELDDFSRSRLLEGLDAIALTLRHEAAIAAYESTRAAWLPRAVRRAVG